MPEPYFIRRALPLLLSGILLLAASASPAHELGTVQVYATFHKDGTYSIAIAVDEEHLTRDRMGGPAGETRYGPIGGLTPEVDARLGRFLRQLADGATVAFDRKPVTPRVEVAQASGGGSPGRVELRLLGDIPPGSRSFNWSHSLEMGTYPLVLQNEGDESAVWRWLEGGATSAPFELRAGAAPPPPSRSEVVRRYFVLGFTHILPHGTDHILFVLGLFFLSRRWKPILLQVTSFTVAHTITLALTIYGFVSLPPSVVEPLIALSIVYVAVENLFTRELHPWRVALVFAFGLLHGMGFAGILSELGLPRSESLPALISFNLGVEAGQITVIAGVFLLVGLPLRDRIWYRRRVVVPASCLIAAVGLYWSVQRAFF
jgi:hypothetical protein